MTRLAVGTFRVDLDALDACVATLTSTEAHLERLSNDLVVQLQRAHEGWQGEAALAHRQVQRQWDLSFGHLRQALTALRAAAGHAHASYCAATDANQAMWAPLG